MTTGPLENDELIATLERIMPRHWLTPDLRYQVAEWVIEQLSEAPWRLTVSTKRGGCICPRDPEDQPLLRAPYEPVPTCPEHGANMTPAPSPSVTAGGDSEGDSPP